MLRSELEEFRKFVLRSEEEPVPRKRSSVELPKWVSTHGQSVNWRGHEMLVLSVAEAKRLSAMLSKRPVSRPHRIFQRCATCWMWIPVGSMGVHAKSHRAAHRRTLAINVLDTRISSTEEDLRLLEQMMDHVTDPAGRVVSRRSVALKPLGV